MTKALPITASTSLLLSVRNTCVKAFAIVAAAATSVLEVFDGTFGTIATAAVGDGGTLYAVGDTITVIQVGGGVQAVFTVATVDAPETGVITGLTLVSGGTGYAAGATHATTTDSVAGSGATVTVSTITDEGTLIGKLSATANTGDASYPDCLTTKGVSVRITGASATGFLYHE